MPIVMTPEEWARIVRWTETGREDPETVRIREYVKYLTDSSKEMTKFWPNSVENVNKRNEELRLARIDAAEKANSKFYKRYVKRKKEEEARLMYSARDTIFKNKDAPKLLLSAVIETVTLKEREEQIKFNKELKAITDEQKKQEDEAIMQHSKEWHELQAERAKRRFEVNKKHQKDILEQVKEVADRERKEKEDEVNMQKLDNMNANREMDAIKKFEQEFKEKEKARIFNDMKNSREETENRRREQAELQKMDDKLQDVLARSRARTHQKRLQTEKNEREEKQRVLAAISDKLQTGTANRDAHEQACLDKARRESQAADDARRDKQARKEADIKQQRLDSRAQFLAEEKQRLHEEETMMRWSLMNRFKNEEIYEDYKEELRKEKARKVKEFREETLRLRKEREERDAREVSERRDFYGAQALQKLRDADNKLLTHADKLLEEARAHGRPTLPITKIVDRYCALYRLYPLPPLPASLQEHFGRYAPRDGTRPDAAYREPPPPPPRRCPDAPDHDVVKKDGLQPQPGPSKPKEEKKGKKENRDDYKRAGPANGMQAKKGGMDVYVTSLPMTPCPAHDCTCVFKL